ncbi:MAG: alpha-amylase family protein [Planctomycetota bacterium]|jgi:hypothetical protein
MDRREFLTAGVGATLAGSTVSSATSLTAEAAVAKNSRTSTPEILATYTAKDHRLRLENIAICERGIGECMRKHLITDYMPGHCAYNLGEYPCLKPWNPDDWDEQELDKLRNHGIGLIHLHEEWNDPQRLFGGHKLAPLNPAGFRRFIDMAHKRGMKVEVYFSTGYFDWRDPDFSRQWARQGDLNRLYFRYAHCSPASPGWRAYLLPRICRVMDEYGIDGFYNDLGYTNIASNPAPPAKDEVLAFKESTTHDGAMGDLLALIYAEVKRRGGTVKIHAGAGSRPQVDMKVYDYLWVGETVKSADNLRETTKNHPPYVVPCLDMARGARIENEDELYLHSIPYMQFPLLLAGRPFTGQRSVIPGIEYLPAAYLDHCRAAWKHYQANPDGPHCYAWWDSVPGRTKARPTHAYWLKQYLPMVEEGTWAWLEISKSSLFLKPLPQGIVASAFANRRLYLVLANYNRNGVEVETSDTYVSVAEPSAAPKKRWNLPARSLHILRRPA